MPSIIGAIRRRRTTSASERGQGLVEFTLIMPLMLVLIFTLVDFGRGFHTWLVVTNAAREGARVAATQKDYATVQTRIYDSLGSLDPADLVITPTNIQGTRGDPVEIDLAYDFQYVTPIGDLVTLISGGTLTTPTITAHASMRLE